MKDECKLHSVTKDQANLEGGIACHFYCGPMPINPYKRCCSLKILQGQQDGLISMKFSQIDR